MCLMVCPFGVRFDAERDRVVLCDVCSGRDTPACVVACPTRALGVSEAEPVRASSDFGGRVVVVGSSAAGVAACEAAREIAPNCSITLVTADAGPQYSRPLLAYALAGRFGHEGLDWRAAEYLKNLGVEIVRRARAESVRPDARVVVLADSREITYDSLVIATGARGKRLRVPGADLPGVFTLRDVEDLVGIEALARPGGRAVVLGGGNVGLQTCEALLERGLDVAVVYRSSHLLSQMVDAEAGRRVAALFARHRLALRPGRDAVEILGPGRVTAVRLDDGEELPAELVVVGKGISPNVEWLRGSGIEVGSAVKVDRCGRTNVAGVFAAGDCAETLDSLTGETSVSGIWPVAYEMGRVAGATAVGAERESAGALRLNASRFFGETIIAIGEVRLELLPHSRAEVLVSTDDVYRKLVYRGERLVGAILYGDISQAGQFYRQYREAACRPPGLE
jgi:nitrite reductase (NADH) large subunit